MSQPNSTSPTPERLTPAEPAERPDGWYWVRWNERSDIGPWVCCEWEAPGWLEDYPEHNAAPAEIGPRIPSPDELRAHAAYLETQEWQPIETAPKDGTRILAYFPGNPESELFFPPTIAIAAWREMSPTVQWEPVDVDQELWRRSITTPAFFESEDDMSINPTHWMPLPKPPEAR